ncbi:replication initiator protein A [Alienimonas chondri]|uniref:Replication initiator protein A n=1 Tax=Alienimonas chondri TaxID=2681879 RepID=A0ABX1VD53_9PLAN|nr:replication initiator protein A [Alienimonas chondri]NNJ25979.1 hypothetical protein [Alienimonas chondri]
MRGAAESEANAAAGWYDELNLAEFGLASAGERRLDGKKTVIFEDTVWDKEARKRLPRKLAISGSDLYGLPTAKDDDVLLACVQLSAAGGFADRDVQFSRYELLKLLRWEDSTRNYRRLSKSLRRWAGLTVYSSRAFYDHRRKSWVNRDFGVIDNLIVYEREASEGAAAPQSSRFTWNQVFFDSFQAGYLKRLDWDLYCRLQSPVAKRLYRFLDKRFYRGGKVEADLRTLSERTVRLSASNHTGQHKRQLLVGIAELEREWELKPTAPAERFRREARGKWTVVFERKRRSSSKSVATDNALTGAAADLAAAGVSATMAARLAKVADERTVRTMLALFEHYRQTGKRRDAGFLVNCVRDPAGVRFPPNFVEPKAAAPRTPPDDRSKSRIRPLRDSPGGPGAKAPPAKSVAQRAFSAFWDGLDGLERAAFEREAAAACGPLLRDGLERTRTGGGAAFEAYRKLVLREHYQRIRGGPADAD